MKSDFFRIFADYMCGTSLKNKLMKHLFLCLIIGIGCFSNAFGQLLTVGNQKVSKEEFVRMYERSNPNPSFSERSLREYLDRLIVFKLKLQQALDENLDKLPHIQSDLKNYAEQLAQPYLTDRELLEELLQEAYNFSAQDAHARQIMVRVSPFASPQDTLAAYRTALRIRNRLIRGENFDKVAAEETENSDMVLVGARQESRVRASDLRYFNAFAMPYPIEKFAFTSKIGEFSMPLRTNMGYHIVQSLDRQPTLGRINASQIFLNVANDAEEGAVRRKADSLYTLIINGDRTFEELARQFSDDMVSRMRGGRMAEFNVTRVEPRFISALYRMPIEVVSRPFRAERGYHIVIIHSVEGIGSYEAMRPELLHHLQRNERAELVRQSFVNSLARVYPVIETRGALRNFANSLDSTEISGFWMYEPDKWADSVLVKVGNQIGTYKEFGSLIERNQMDYRQDEERFMTFIERNFRRYIEELLIRCETENIGKKHEEFNRDFKEYRDALLVFEITDRNVWRRSVEDTIGLYEYYESQKHCHMWPERIQALIFRYDVRHVNTNHVHRFLTSSYRKRLSAEQIIDQAHRNFDPKHVSVTLNVYEPGQNKFADRVDWTRLGLSQDVAAGGFEKGFVYIYNFFPSTCKSLEDVRGIMVAQYQAILENEWVAELRKKYNIQVNREKFEQLIKR